MHSQSAMDVLEVNKQIFMELQDMGFSPGRAARALHHSGNAGLEAAINWLVDHENDPDIDQMPLVAMNIDIDSSQSFNDTEEIQKKAQELREHARRKKKEEEKKLEWEREKERIRAGKEILASKHIAEDNERKRHLALRKADKEEEQRAREKILHKLEADKAERRRMLGLPSVSHTTSKHAGPGVQELKLQNNNFHMKSTTKGERLRECLRSMRQNHKDDDAAVKQAFRTLLVCVGNVARNPDTEKFRKIRVSNPSFHDRIARLEGGIEFLELCGFERTEDGKFLFLPQEKVDMAVLHSAGSELNSAITNPYFGLLSYVKNTEVSNKIDLD